MDYTPRYSVHSNSESSVTAYTVPIGYQLNLKTHWHNNMYSMQNLDSPSKQQLLRENIDKNKTNFSFCRMYSANQSLNDNKPKKETLWQSVFRSATNLLGEHLTRGTSSFIKNWSSMNNPLSVTVVSPDFYKSMQQEKEHQLINASESLIVPRTWSKEPHSSGETLPNVLYDNEITSHSTKRNYSDSNDSDKRWKEYKCMFVDFNKSQEKDLIKNEQIVDSVKTSDCKSENLESHFNIVVIDDKGLTLTEDEEPVMIEKPEESTLEIRQEQPQAPTKASQEPTSVTSMLTNAYNKVVSGVVDYLQLGSAAPEPQCDPNLDVDLEFELSSLLTKRGCSPKTRLRRLHDVSSGRGRGRAKSQLRRSGVSQTRHRKERNRHECAADIKSDIDSWEKLEYCAEDVDEVDHETQLCNEDDVQRTSFTFADVKLKRRKPEKSKNCVWGQFARSPKNLDKGGLQEKPAFRPRLLSDSSVDSEESYYIVFEDDTSSNECDFETDVKSYTETEEEEVLSKTKVRFNPMPIIHTMIQWNYAYRAARRGPWEEMARDRERFRSRINCVGHVLEPVLAKQHRIRVWHERFDDQNIVF